MDKFIVFQTSQKTWQIYKFKEDSSNKEGFTYCRWDDDGLILYTNYEACKAKVKELNVTS